MFEKMSPIKVDQSILVIGEIGRHPVQYHTDALLMQGVYEKHEVLRCAKAAGRCKITQGLIAPRAVKRMFHYLEKFHMSEAHVFYVFSQLLSHFPVCEGTVVLLSDPAPRTDMNLINRKRRVPPIGFMTIFHPIAIFPLVVQASHHRSCLG